MARIDRFGGNNTPQSSDELHDKNERAKVAIRDPAQSKEGVENAPGQQAPKKVLAAGDAERLMSQAGYVGSKKKRPGHIDLGDSSQAPIPLPEDDVDASLWSGEALADVQGQLGAQAALLRQVQEQALGGRIDGAKGLWEAMVAASFADDGEEHADGEPGAEARLLALAANPAPDPKAMGAMAQSAQAHFGLELSGLEAGAQLMAASLLVAGQKHQLEVVMQEPNSGVGPAVKLDGTKLTTGVEAVLSGGRAAVDDGRRMNEGVSKNLAMHRTFVAKR